MRPLHKLENQKFLKGLENNSDIDKYFADQAKFMSTKQKFDRIDNFNDEFDFLNNDFDTPVALDGELYPNVSQAHQAAKTPVPSFRKRLQAEMSPYDLYDLAKQIPNPPNWDADKLQVMERLLRDKFIRNPDIRSRLAATGERELVNAYKDKTPANLYWGSVAGDGENHIGKLLAKIRESVAQDKDLEHWLGVTLHFPRERPLFPTFQVSVVKDGKQVEEHRFGDKGVFYCGNSSASDFPMAHPSVSRTHCLFGFDQRLGVVVVDLGSTNGTTVGDAKLTPFIPCVVPTAAFQFVCGSSTRTNLVTVNFAAVKRYLENQKRKLERQDDDTGEASTRGAREHTKLHISGNGRIPRRSELEDVFDRFGEVRHVDVLEDKRRGGGAWFGFVRFARPRGVERTLKQPGIFIDDQKIAVKIAETN